MVELFAIKINEWKQTLNFMVKLPYWIKVPVEQSKIQEMWAKDRIVIKYTGKCANILHSNHCEGVSFDYTIYMQHIKIENICSVFPQRWGKLKGKNVDCSSEVWHLSVDNCISGLLC